MRSSSTEPASPAGERRWGLLSNLALSVVATGVFFLLLEGFASLALSALAAKRTLYMREESHSRYDPDLGWSHRPSLRIESLYGPQVSFTTNAQGFRAREDYAKAPPAGRKRLIALGDSFTMGYGVADDETYAARMQQACPALQTVNMGQGGYGLDQDFLWYRRDGAKLDADVLLFAMIAQDFFRMSSDTFIGYPKPVLRVRDGRLAVDNVPVPRDWDSRTTLRRVRTFMESLALVRAGYFVAGRASEGKPERFYGTVGPDVLAAAGAAFDELAALSRARGQAFVLVYLPVSDLLAKEPTPEAAWMAEYGRRSGVPVINLVADFERLTPAELARMFRPDFHYSQEGNRFVAAALLRRLAEAVPGFPACPAAPAPRGDKP